MERSEKQNARYVAERKFNEYGDRSSSEFFENRVEREWLSTKEAAHFLSVSENALRIMVHRGQIETYKIGRRLRFKVRDCTVLFQRKGA